MTDKKTRVLSNLLSLVLGAGIGAGCYRAIEQITQGTQKIEMEAPPEEVGGGVIISESEGSGMQLTATKLSSSEYAENGVSAIAESAYILTASDDAVRTRRNKAVDWAIGFKNANARPGRAGKTVTDYVTVTPSSGGKR